MKKMRKCNDEVYQLAKDQALVKKLKNKRFPRYIVFNTHIFIFSTMIFMLYRGKNTRI